MRSIQTRLILLTWSCTVFGNFWLRISKHRPQPMTCSTCILSSAIQRLLSTSYASICFCRDSRGGNTFYQNSFSCNWFLYVKASISIPRSSKSKRPGFSVNCQSEICPPQASDKKSSLNQKEYSSPVLSKYFCLFSCFVLWECDRSIHKFRGTLAFYFLAIYDDSGIWEMLLEVSWHPLCNLIAWRKGKSTEAL